MYDKGLQPPYPGSLSVYPGSFGGKSFSGTGGGTDLCQSLLFVPVVQRKYAGELFGICYPQEIGTGTDAAADVQTVHGKNLRAVRLFLCRIFFHRVSEALWPDSQGVPQNNPLKIYPKTSAVTMPVTALVFPVRKKISVFFIIRIFLPAYPSAYSWY